MSLAACIPLLLFVAAAVPSTPPAASYASLWNYNGAWRVTKQNQSPGAKPEELVNRCALVGTYFTCQQTVNGQLSGLLVFIPSKTAGEFFTQSILPDGRAAGRGQLSIEGDKWTFLSNWNQGGKTIFYRTVNVFSGKSKIHFEQQESSNNKDWKITGGGDEVRMAAGKITVVP